MPWWHKQSNEWINKTENSTNLLCLSINYLIFYDLDKVHYIISYISSAWMFLVQLQSLMVQPETWTKSTHCLLWAGLILLLMHGSHCL